MKDEATMVERLAHAYNSINLVHDSLLRSDSITPNDAALLSSALEELRRIAIAMGARNRPLENKEEWPNAIKDMWDALL